MQTTGAQCGRHADESTGLLARRGDRVAQLVVQTNTSSRRAGSGVPRTVLTEIRLDTVGLGGVLGSRVRRPASSSW